MLNHIRNEITEPAKPKKNDNRLKLSIGVSCEKAEDPAKINAVNIGMLADEIAAPKIMSTCIDFISSFSIKKNNSKIIPASIKTMNLFMPMGPRSSRLKVNKAEIA